MMPDRYDELRKRLMIADQAQIKPIMGEQTVLNNSLQEQIDVPIEEVPVEEIPSREDQVQRLPAMSESELRRSRQEDVDTNRALANLAVAAGSSLTGFMGGTAAERASRFGDSRKYLQDIGKIESDKLKTLKEIKNEEGNPEYIAQVNAVGKEPYHALKGAGAGSSSAAKSFTPFDIYRPSTGERFNVVWNSREGKYQGLDGGEAGLEPTDIIKPVANKLIKTEDVGGTVNVKEYNQYDKQPTKQIVTEPGIGPAYGVATKGQGEAIEKGLQEGQKEFQKYSGSIKDIESAQKTISSGNSVRALSAAIYSLVRATEPMGVLTAQDFNTISGTDMMPMLEQVEGFAAKKFGGNLDEVRASYNALAEDIKKRLQDRLESIPSRFQPGTTAGEKGIKSIIPTKEIEKISKERKAKLIEIETQAKKFFGKNKAAYDGFVNKKKQELGL